MKTKLWNQYKETREYAKLTELFSVENVDVIEKFLKVAQYMEEAGLCTEVAPEEIADNCIDVLLNFEHQGFVLPEVMTREWYEHYIDEFELRYNYDDEKTGDVVFDNSPEGVMVPKERFREKNACILFISIFLYYGHEFFKPMLCRSSFHIIVRNCERLEIDLPEYPKAKDYKGFMMWYYDFCEVLNDFQKKYNMTDAELCACLYGFASNLEDDEEKTELPTPINVWMTGASGEDYKHLEALDNNYSLWACNENTRRGDIVVIYALSPHSHIHSIWRADSEGVFNPFDYYQARTHVTDGVKIPPISLAEMKADPVFGKLPMLNNNLQVINGKRLPTWAYQALLRMIKAKGGNMSKIPVLFEAQDWNPGEIKLEKDVEEKCLIPCLESLGYKEGDWTRQLSLKAGREEKAIPDFVFFPYGEVHAENAPLIIEAKKNMSSERERDKAYRQGRSYAKMLDAPIMGICDEERLVVYVRNANKAFDYTRPAFEAHWAAIAGDVEVHAQLMQLIGAEVIKKKKA